MYKNARAWAHPRWIRFFFFFFCKVQKINGSKWVMINIVSSEKVLPALAVVWSCLVSTLIDGVSSESLKRNKIIMIIN